jgi:hypothetical protein
MEASDERPGEKLYLAWANATEHIFALGEQQGARLEHLFHRAKERARTWPDEDRQVVRDLYDDDKLTGQIFRDEFIWVNAHTRDVADL